MTPETLAALLLSRAPKPPASVPRAADEAAAKHVASLALRAPPPPPPRVPLAAFFARARAHAAEARALASASGLADPREKVCGQAAGFDVAGVVFGKMQAMWQSEEVKAVVGGAGERDIWLLFCVGKAKTGIDRGKFAGSCVHAFHMLLACLVLVKEGGGEGVRERDRKRRRVEGGAVEVEVDEEVEEGVEGDEGETIAKLCASTGAVTSEVEAYVRKLRDLLPEGVLAVLPVRSAVRAAGAKFEEEYQRLLDKPGGGSFIDERVFVDAPHLVAPMDEVDDVAAAGAAGARAKIDFGFVAGADSAKEQPREFVKFVRDDARAAVRRVGREGDALDALAAVASSTPRSPAPGMVGASSGATALREVMLQHCGEGVGVVTPKAQILRPVGHLPPPTTPVSRSLAAVTWLQGLADGRPETQDGSEALLEGDVRDVKTSAALKDFMDKHEGAWVEVVERVRSLVKSLTKDGEDEMRDEDEDDAERAAAWDDPQVVRESCAVYFAALEGVFTHEAKRLSKTPTRILGVLKSLSFHKSMLVCSFEVTSAAYGSRRMQAIPVALKRLDLTPFELSKCIETFVRRLDALPANVARHIAVCEHRLLEMVVWYPGSPLVLALHARTASSSGSGVKPPLAAANPGSSGGGGDESPSLAANTAKPSKSKQEAGNGQGSTVVPKSVPEAALEMFYLKFLAMASDRMQELLHLLGLEAIAEDVWEVVKYCSWQKWHLMVGRHLDQIIMCAVYGIGKVRQIALTFKDIIKQYRILPHVCEPSFHHLNPSTFRDVSLGNVDITRTASATEDQRGDIIKFYNQVFIHSTKQYLLSFQPSASGATPPVRPAENGLNNPSAPLPGETAGAVGQQPAAGGTSPTRPTQDSSGRVDRVHLAVMKSPMRVSRRQIPTRRIGSVTVSPMSRHGRSMSAIRQSPLRRNAPGSAAAMTPATRKLYAFGESPSRNLETINRTLSAARQPLQFDPTDRAAAIRQKQSDLWKNRGIPTLDTGEGAPSEGGAKGGEEGSGKKARGSESKIEKEGI